MVTRQTFVNGGKKGVKLLISFVKYIVPPIIVIKLLEHSGAMDVIAQWCAPAMRFIGLPGEAALVVLISQFSLYSGLAATATLALGVKETTIILGFVGCLHAGVIESAVVAKAGANTYLVLALRFLAAVLTAFTIGLIM